MLESMSNFLSLLKRGDDAALYETLSRLPREKVTRSVSDIAGAITIQAGRPIAAVGFIPSGGNPCSPTLRDVSRLVKAAFVLGESLVATRQADYYRIVPYDNLRTPSQMYYAAKACVDLVQAEDQFVFDEITSSALPVLLLLALPKLGQGSGVPVQERLRKVTDCVLVTLLPSLAEDEEGSSLDVTPALPLPEAVEHGRAMWLSQFHRRPVALPDSPWAYEVAGEMGECLFTEFSLLSTNFAAGTQVNTESPSRWRT